MKKKLKGCSFNLDLTLRPLVVKYKLFLISERNSISRNS